MTQLNLKTHSKNSKLRLKTWLKILKTSNYIEKIIRENLRETHQTTLPRFDVMSALYRSNEGLTMNEISRLSKKYNLPVANAFHAGDGNLHPLIMFDSNDKKSLAKTEKFGAEILKYCVKVGGVLTGEHGVGIEKRELMCEAFNNDDIQQQISIKIALDPSSLLNPGKVYPILRKCAEEGRVHVHGGKTKFPDIPRF